MTHHIGLLQMDCESAPLTAPAEVAEFDWDDGATVGGVHPVENITLPTPPKNSCGLRECYLATHSSLLKLH